ncbi:MAG: hypothetical protein WB564_09730, partial [Dehalococcoidia bacterium]
MKKRALYSIMVLALVLMPCMALTLPTPVGAATVIFTGNVSADFTGPPHVLIIPDPVGDVGIPTTPIPAPPGTVSGWDMVDLRLTYDANLDIMYVGMNSYGIVGDADGDGDPSHTSAWLNSSAGGKDLPDMNSTENVAVYFDLNKDGLFDVIAGKPIGPTIQTGFEVATYNTVIPPESPGLAFLVPLPLHTGIYTIPSAVAPNFDFEFTITHWSTLAADLGIVAPSLGDFIVWAFMGSLADDGIGEDYIEYEQNPHTIATISANATKVRSGGSVSLNVSEWNPLAVGNVSQTSPQVAVNTTPPVTLAWPPFSGDDNGNQILDPGENWTWINILSGAITGPTTFVASGSGVAPGDFAVNYTT